MASNLGPGYSAFAKELLSRSVADLAKEHALRQQAAGGAAAAAGPSNAAAAGGGGAASPGREPAPADSEAAAAAAAAAQPILNPPEAGRGGQKRRFQAGAEQRALAESKRATREAISGPHAEAIKAALKVTKWKQLKAACRAKGLRTSGTKIALLTRLAESLQPGADLAAAVGSPPAGAGVNAPIGSAAAGSAGGASESDDDDDEMDAEGGVAPAPGLLQQLGHYIGLT